MDKGYPRLRTVNKSVPPFPLNEFPPDFPYSIGGEIVYFLSTRGDINLEGSDWEKMFAQCIGAQWKPSNVGLDDVVLGNTAWGAKTVKNSSPSKAKTIRLISGRNSPKYSYGIDVTKDIPTQELGNYVLAIYNERVSFIRERYKHLRTVVLVKSNDLSEVVVFEYETILYDPDQYLWSYNKNENLVGTDKRTGNHKFTWQPHGSQFTIVETVPAKALLISIRKPPLIDREIVLKGLNFSKDWVKVTDLSR